MLARGDPRNALTAAERVIELAPVAPVGHVLRALVFYGNSGMHWADFNVRDLQKAAGYREGRPVSPAAVYLAPPFNRRKERFRSVSTSILRQTSEEIERAALDDFVEALRASRKEAGQ